MHNLEPAYEKMYKNKAEKLIKMIEEYGVDSVIDFLNDNAFKVLEKYAPNKYDYLFDNCKRFKERAEQTNFNKVGDKEWE